MGECKGSRPHLCRSYARRRTHADNATANQHQAVYQSLLHLSWVDKLLDNIRVLFVDLYGDQVKKPYSSVVECDFEGYFDQQVRELESSAEKISQKPPQILQDDSGLATGIEKGLDVPPPPIPGLLSGQKPATSATTSADATPTSTPDTSRPSTPSNGHLLAAKPGRGGGVSRRARKAASATPASVGDLKTKDKGTNPKGKKMRRWDADGVADDDDEVPLDYSAASDADSRPVSSSGFESVDATTSGMRTSKGQYVLKDLDSEVHSILQNANEKKAQPTSTTSGVVGSGIGVISGLFKNVIGGKVLTKEDLEKPMKGMEEHLLKKNVAREAAVRLCEGVERELIGTKTGSFESTFSFLTIHISFNRVY